MKKAYLILAEGFETLEALAPVDILRRCGIDITTVSITDSKRVLSSHDIYIEADALISHTDLSDGDMLILPGGPGHKNLGKSQEVMKAAKDYINSSDKFLAAICAAPSILESAGLLKGRKVSCHYTVKELMEDSIVTEDMVVQDGNLITASGAGRAMDFALKLGEVLSGEEKVQAVKTALTI